MGYVGGLLEVVHFNNGIGIVKGTFVFFETNGALLVGDLLEISYTLTKQMEEAHKDTFFYNTCVFVTRWMIFFYCYIFKICSEYELVETTEKLLPKVLADPLVDAICYYPVRQINPFLYMELEKFNYEVGTDIEKIRSDYLTPEVIRIF